MTKAKIFQPSILRKKIVWLFNFKGKRTHGHCQQSGNCGRQGAVGGGRWYEGPMGNGKNTNV